MSEIVVLDLYCFLFFSNVWFLLCLLDIFDHSEEGHCRSGGDVRRDGPYLHKLLKQPGPYTLGQLCLSFSQNPGLLGQRPGSSNLLHPGIHTQTHTELCKWVVQNKEKEMNTKHERTQLSKDE